MSNLTNNTAELNKILAAVNALPDAGGGITPHIGENGNWFIGETDTGVRAQGDDYVLTDADKVEIAELAADMVDVPESGGDVWELIADITTEEEVGRVIVNDISLKKMVIQAKGMGTTSNASATNAPVLINGFMYFYPQNASGNTATPKYFFSYVEVVGNSKTHTSSTNNNNTYQSNNIHKGWFGDGTPITEIIFDANSVNGRLWGISSNFRVWGVRV